MLAKAHHRHLVWLCSVLPHDRVCHAQNTSHDDKQPPRSLISMSEKLAWRHWRTVAFICAFLHDITREARHFSTLTNGLLTVLDNQKKRYPTIFPSMAIYASCI